MAPLEVGDQGAVEQRCHQQPRDLALQRDRPISEREQRRVEPGTGWRQRRPGQGLTFGELVVIEKHLDEDVLTEEPQQKDREGTPMPAAKDLPPATEREPDQEQPAEANRARIRERVEDPVDVDRNHRAQLGGAAKVNGVTPKPAVREPQLPPGCASDERSDVYGGNPSRDDPLETKEGDQQKGSDCTEVHDRDDSEMLGFQRCFLMPPNAPRPGRAPTLRRVAFAP